MVASNEASRRTGVGADSLVGSPLLTASMRAPQNTANKTSVYNLTRRTLLKKDCPRRIGVKKLQKKI